MSKKRKEQMLHVRRNLLKVVVSVAVVMVLVFVLFTFVPKGVSVGKAVARGQALDDVATPNACDGNAQFPVFLHTNFFLPDGTISPISRAEGFKGCCPSGYENNGCYVLLAGAGKCSLPGDIPRSDMICSDGKLFDCALREGANGRTIENSLCVGVNENVGQWRECNQAIEGEDNLGYLCTFNNENGQFSWVSNDICDLDMRYYFKDNRNQICNGDQWIPISCNNLNDIRESNIRESNMRLACLQGHVVAFEQNCNNGVDDDKNGQTDEADNNCRGNLNRQVQFDSNYELVTKKGDNFKFLITTPFGVSNSLNLCDSGTPLVSDEATICETPVGSYLRTGRQVLTSLSLLHQTNEKPLYDNRLNLTYLYYGPDEAGVKKVSIFLTQDISINLQNFPLRIFTRNLLEGQSLMLLQDNEFYLLSYTTSEELFTPEHLKLTHIPTDQDYIPVNHPGTNQYIFGPLLGGKQIVVGIAEDQFRISSLAPGEVPAAYVIPHNLTKEYEVSFTKDTPISITNPADIGKLTVCQDDNARDSEQVKVCRDNILAFTLQKDVLTKRNIPINGPQDYAFLFTLVNNIKQVSIFSLDSLSNIKTSLLYDDFINNMVAGRRIAFEFQGNLYLMKHPVAPLISLPALTVTGFGAQVGVPLPTSGSEGEVEINIFDGGKIFLKRNYGSPPPPFDIKALTNQELRPVDLESDLFTSFSSLGPLQFVEPDLGTLQVRDTDVKFSAPTFKLSSDDPNHPNIDLNLAEPREFGTALFYYHTAAISNRIPVKSVSIYRYYSLNTLEQGEENLAPVRSYDDAFISVFTGGKELALKFGSNYYLLGHQNNPNEPAFFDLHHLILKTLNKTQTFNVVVESATQASFAVPEGKIVVKTDDFANTISFLATTQEALETFIFEEDVNYSISLTTTNNVKIRGIADITLNMCNPLLYSSLPSADVCYGAEDIVVDGAAVLSLNEKNYLLETNGQMGANKRVLIRRIITLSSLPLVSHSEDDWAVFVTHVAANDKPIFNVSNSFYLPVATDTRLQNLQLQAVHPTGSLYSLRNVHQMSPITSNGTFVLGDDIVFVNQVVSGNVDARKVTTQFIPQAYSFLPEDNTVLTLDSSKGLGLSFATALNGKLYTLSVVPPGMAARLVQVRFSADDSVLLFKLFREGDTKVLVLDGVPLQMTVTTIENGKVIITLQRT